MADYSELKQNIASVIKSNNRREITGQILQNVLNQMVGSLGENYQLAGFAEPTTNPQQPDQTLFYIAEQAGVYTNFDNITLGDGLSFLMWKNSEWTSHTIGVATHSWVDSNYVSKAFLRQIFRVYDADGFEILPNDTTSIADNIKAMVGLWTNQYLSALGLGDDGQTGAQYLTQLGDVDIDSTTLADGQVLVYDNGLWVNGQAGGVDMSVVWAALAGNTNEQINASHLTTALTGYVTSSSLSTTLADYVTTTALNTALASYASQSWVSQNYVSIAFLNRILRAYDSTDTQVQPNDTTTAIDNLKAMVGLWTEQYLSALGQGNDGGGGGYITTLGQLEDVLLTTPSVGQALVYAEVESGVYKWVNGTAGVDMSSVWIALAGSTNEQIALSHLTAALSGYVTTSGLSTTLADYVTSTALSTTLADYVTSTALSTTLASYATQQWVGQNYISIAFFNRLFAAYDSSNVIINPNDTTTAVDNIKALVGLWTQQYLSALGQGSDGGGGGQGDVTWALLADDTDTRQIALSHLTSALTGYATESWVSNTLSPYATQSWVGNNYLPLTGGTLDGGSTRTVLTINSNHTYGPEIRFTKNNTLTSRLLSYTNYMVMATPDGCEVGLNNSAVVFSSNSGSTYYNILHTGNIKTINGQSIFGSGDINVGGGGGSYLPLSGGTITSSEHYPLTINSTAYYTYLRFQNGGTNKSYVGWYPSDGLVMQNGSYYLEIRDAGGLKYHDGSAMRDVWHSGNLSPLTTSNYSSYCLPLSGGTLSGSSSVILNINTTSQNNYINFLVNSVSKAQLGYYNGTGVFIQNETSTWNYPTFSISDDGLFSFNAKNTWLSNAVLQLMRNDDTSYSDRACIGVTDGNLHIDSYSSHDIYLNYYSGSAVVHIAGYTVIHSGNIGSQSVAYATSAGSATDSTKLPLSGGTLTGDLKVVGTKNLSHPAWDYGVIAGADGHNKVVLSYLASNTNGAVIGSHNSNLTAWAELNVAGTSINFRIEETVKAYLSNSGDFVCNGGVTSLSDARHKAVIQDVSLSVEQIAQMPAVLFRWTDKLHDNTKIYAGTLAQSWEGVLPQVVSIEDNAERTRNFAYGVAALIAATIDARKIVDHDRLLREQAAKISELENKCSFLEREVERLKCA